MSETASRPRFVIGASHKMYFSHAKTLDWSAAVAGILSGHEAIATGAAEFFAVPSFLSIPAVVSLLAGHGVGAQNLAEHDSGAFTGEVSGAVLAELGCTLAEIGHAERRTLFGESDAVVAAKCLAAARNGLTPLLCVGEPERSTVQAAVERCLAELRSALQPVQDAGLAADAIVAYEPYWAIGAEQPAPPDYVVEVCGRLRERLGEAEGFAGARVIYGGSAAPGLLPQIADGVDGLFLGRFAHDPEAVRLILDEALELSLAEPSR